MITMIGRNRNNRVNPAASLSATSPTLKVPLKLWPDLVRVVTACTVTASPRAFEVVF